jgi:hypothetical protein
MASPSVLAAVELTLRFQPNVERGARFASTVDI